MTAPTILALDLGSVTGCAEGRADEPRPRLWTWTLGGAEASQAARLAELVRLVADHLAVAKPDRVWIEAPMQARAAIAIGDREATIRFLFGAAAVVHAVAYMRGCWNVREANVSQVRRHFIGTAHGKGAVMSKCRVLGWQPRNHNEGDAAALWSFAAAHANPRTAHLVDPLFQGCRS